MLEHVPLDKRLNHMESVVTDIKFRSNKGLGNDIPYYIFDYDPKSELVVSDYISSLIKRVNGQNLGFNIIEYNIYDMILDILEAKGFLQKCFEMEEKYGHDHLVKAISNMLRMAESTNPIVETIVKDTPPNSIVFLTGIGQSYPIVRAHNILNNLQQVFDTMPVVMFYPGNYTGQELHLFGTIKEDNYYRAFPFPKP